VNSFCENPNVRCPQGHSITSEIVRVLFIFIVIAFQGLPEKSADLDDPQVLWMADVFVGLEVPLRKAFVA
jgi:hypothetical protein